MSNSTNKDLLVEETACESAYMNDDFSISIQSSWLRPSGACGDGWFEIKPTDDGYEEVKQKYSLTKPGDTYENTTKRMVHDREPDPALIEKYGVRIIPKGLPEDYAEES